MAAPTQDEHLSGPPTDEELIEELQQRRVATEANYSARLEAIAQENRSERDQLLWEELQRRIQQRERRVAAFRAGLAEILGSIKNGHYFFAALWAVSDLVEACFSAAGSAAKGGLNALAAGLEAIGSVLERISIGLYKATVVTYEWVFIGRNKTSLIPRDHDPDALETWFSDPMPDPVAEVRAERAATRPELRLRDVRSPEQIPKAFTGTGERARELSHTRGGTAAKLITYAIASVILAQRLATELGHPTVTEMEIARVDHPTGTTVVEVSNDGESISGHSTGHATNGPTFPIETQLIRNGDVIDSGVIEINQIQPGDVIQATKPDLYGTGNPDSAIAAVGTATVTSVDGANVALQTTDFAKATLAPLPSELSNSPLGDGGLR